MLLKCELASATNSVRAGSRMRISFSSLVRKRAERPRTRSETPSQCSNSPPSVERSTRRTSHSSSRTTMRAPGAGVLGDAEAVISRKGCGGDPLLTQRQWFALVAALPQPPPPRQRGRQCSPESSGSLFRYTIHFPRELFPADYATAGNDSDRSVCCQRSVWHNADRLIKLRWVVLGRC